MKASSKEKVAINYVSFINTNIKAGRGLSLTGNPAHLF